MASGPLADNLVNEQRSLVPQVLSRQTRQNGAEELLLGGKSETTRNAGRKAEVRGQFVRCQSAEPCKEVVHADLNFRDPRVWSRDDRVEEEEASLSMDEFGG